MMPAKGSVWTDTRKQKTTIVPVEGGKRRVRIVDRRGVWAITPMQVESGSLRGFYAVTHMPTGAAMPDRYGEMTLDLARDLMRRLPLRFGHEAESYRNKGLLVMPKDTQTGMSFFAEAQAAYSAFCAEHDFG